MATKAPIEIWHKILKYSISVPLFLDPDPVETHGIDNLTGYMYQMPYWHSERTRNSLRRVCRAWDNFLKPYNHRFIRLDDVLHDYVPATALPSAIRIDFDESPACTCEEHQDSFGDQTYWYSMMEVWVRAPFTSLEEAKISPPVIWETQIVKGWLLDYEVTHSILKSRAPDLRSLLCQPPSGTRSISEFFPGLRILLINDDGNYNAVASLDILRMPSLTTLRLVVTSLNLPIEEGCLSSLRHLRITVCNGGGVEPSREDLYKLTQQVGSRLYTFHLVYPKLSSLPVDERLWEALPMVECIQIPYIWDTTQAPKDHPLRRVQINVQQLSEKMGDINSIVSYLPNFCDRHWTLKIDATWCEELFSRFYSATVVSIEMACRDAGIFLFDAHGSTFTQYIVFVLMAFWKQPNRTYHKPDIPRNWPNMRF